MDSAVPIAAVYLRAAYRVRAIHSRLLPLELRKEPVYVVHVPPVAHLGRSALFVDMIRRIDSKSRPKRRLL